MKREVKPRKQYCATAEYYNSSSHYVYPAERESFITIEYRKICYSLTVRVESHEFASYQSCFPNQTHTCSLQNIAMAIAYEFTHYRTSHTMLSLLSIGAASIEVRLIKHQTEQRNRDPSLKSFLLAEILACYLSREKDTPSFNILRFELLHHYGNESAAKRQYDRIIGTVSSKTIKSNEIKSMI